MPFFRKWWVWYWVLAIGLLATLSRGSGELSFASRAMLEVVGPLLLFGLPIFFLVGTIVRRVATGSMGRAWPWLFLASALVSFVVIYVIVSSGL